MNPTIKITDMLYQPAKATTFDLGLYRDLLVGARVKVAKSRALRIVRPRMDSEY